MSPTNISIIVAFNKSMGIGAKGAIPWNIPEDRAHFKELTMGSTVVMGAKTFKSMDSAPLIGRFNIVVSSTLRNEALHNELVLARNLVTVDEFLMTTENPVFIIGGSRIYSHYLGIASTIYATIVEKDFTELDTFFPVFGEKYVIHECGPRAFSETEGCFYRFVTYKLIADKDKDKTANESGYLELMRSILTHGSPRPDRTGVGTMSLFGKQLRFDLSNNRVPFITTRQLAWKSVIRELLWFLRGSSDSNELEKEGVNIWKGNTSRAFLDARGLSHYREGETGPLYGHALRRYGGSYESGSGLVSNSSNSSWLPVGFCLSQKTNSKTKIVQGFDQLEALIHGIRNDPFSRRHIMTTYNPGVVDQCVLAPCHGIAIQFYVEEVAGDETTFDLSCHVYCRSSDCFLGLPFNIASYAVLTGLVAKKCSSAKMTFRSKELVISMGDSHIYSNHVVQTWTQLGRNCFPCPMLFVSDAVSDKDWADITIDDFELAGYLCNPAIKAEMAI